MEMKAKTNKPVASGDQRSVDAIALLKEQHRVAQKLFDRIEKAGRNETFAIFQILATALLEHMTLEDEVFYPAAAEVDKTHVNQSRIEHEDAKVTIQTILDTKRVDGKFASLVQELKRKIEQHVEEEESHLFPECVNVMGKKKLIELAGKMRGLMVSIEAQGGLRSYQRLVKRRTSFVDGESVL